MTSLLEGVHVMACMGDRVRVSARGDRLRLTFCCRSGVCQEARGSQSVE